jgi:sigma-B regulation protein RsbU (phosphoserine phosphatase)
MNHDLSLILQRQDVPMFATGLYAVIDLAAGRLRVAKAGHPDPLYFNAARGDFLSLRGTDGSAGPALGFFTDAVYRSAEHRFEPGDRLLLYTDGLIEVCGRDGTELGEEGLIELARACNGEGMNRLCDDLVQSVRRFSKTGVFDDDVCLVGVEAAATEGNERQ